ncbi:immunoglobulin domain-containing protein, partial [Aequorivita echinoideorum]|nr:hypothetical protein [Aequorivita echinoideorum]
ATVSQDGDIIVPPALPYIDANNNTSNYGNTFTAAPGSGCGSTENYLNGNDVVYMYTPTMDDVIDIELKDLNGFYAGMFVYESCGDIGTNCVAGTVAGPSDDDLIIEEFDVVAGQTYYIVVSSWLNPSIGYTLEINGFSCSTFPAPVGDANQDFAAPATLADLDVEGTMGGSTLTWYSDAAGTNVIPDTTPLVDQTTYYVSQTFGTCESPLLAITVSEIDCSDLLITATTGGTVACKGTVTLTATSSGTGSEIYWYENQTGGNPVAIGPTFTTPELTATTQYWASEVFIEGTGTAGSVGAIDNNIGAGGGSSIAIGTQRMFFDVTIQTELLSVDIYPTDPIGSSGSVTIRDNTQTVLYDIPYTTTVTGGSTPQTISLNASLSPGTNYEIGQGTSIALYRNTAGAVFPYTSSAITITGTSFNAGYYYWYYNWQFGGGAVLCESPRVPATATVSQSGDKTVGALDYSDTDNTANYGNNFSGAPGCGAGASFLDGNDVVYRYAPTADDIVNIELTGVTNANSGVFVYESCGDVGGNCLGGATSADGYLIPDFYATAGEEYFIVIASQSGSTGYTLNIYGYDCATDLGAPIGDANQFFVGSKTLADLDVEEYVHSTGLNWYSDAAGTVSIPETTPLVNGTTYYVSQTVLGCESPLLAITANEFACTDLEILSTTGDVVCQSGSMTLTAQPGGIGNEVYWYDAQTGGNLVAVGPTLETPVLTATTSYWAEEV